MDEFQVVLPNGRSNRIENRDARHSSKYHPIETQKLPKMDHRGIAAYRTVGKVPPTLKNVKLYLEVLLTFTLSSAARRPRANFRASSLAQKCMKKRCGRFEPVKLVVF